MYQTDLKTTRQMFILGTEKETQYSIIFNVEHMENETKHIMEINKDTLARFFDDKTPKDNWLQDDKFAERIEDAAFWIKNNDSDACYFKDATPNAYRLFKKGGGFREICMSQISNIVDFMSKNNYSHFETFFKL